MKRYILTLLLFLFVLNQINAQFTDDFERYNYTQRISPQSLNWITWSEDPVAGTGYIEDEDGIVSNTDYPNYGRSTHYAFSGKQALFIGKSNLGSVPQNVVLDLHNKSKGTWNLSWQMYIPRNKTASYNFQEGTPTIGSENRAIQVYFNKDKTGTIVDDNGNEIVNFNYPQKEWFELIHTIDLDNDNIIIELITNSSTTEIYNAVFLSDSQHLGGVDFYSDSKKNIFYVDDVVFEKTLPIEDIYIWINNQWEDINGNSILGQPNNSYEVILKEPFTVGTSTVENTLNCLNLVFEEVGNLIVPTQTNVVVSGDLNIPAINTIVVEDGGSFVMLNNTAAIDMPSTNSFEYTRVSDLMNDANDYTYWSSPVANTTVASFGSSVVYTYETANFIDLYSGVGYPQTTGSPDLYDDNGDDWLFANNSDNLISGIGYAVLNPGAIPNQSITFTGVPNNGFISIPVALSGDDTNADDDWNLIGNPYPSAIDATVLINSNINISGTLYFWTHNTVLGGGTNNGPADSNYNPNDYASFNLSGGIAASTGGEIPNGYIAAGQGFFMEVEDNGVVTFNNDMRVVNTVDENTQFYKSTNDKEDSNSDELLLDENKIWLNFFNDKGVFSQSLIAFLPNASDSYEGNYDGVRAGADLNSKFYSILNDKELAIQGRSVWTENVQIPLGFYITKPDGFTLSIGKLEGLLIDDSKNIYLIDNELNISHNLKVADYHFDVSDAGTNNARFTLQFTNATLGIEDIVKYVDFSIINSESSFEIKSNQIVKNIKLYDLLGRLIVQSSPNSKNFNLNNVSIKKGTVIIISAQLENRVVINKKTIKY
ncbi:MAG: hypothetical protein GQ552_02380 [Flavobacteriaceae bacterium]|nr:hypothetical protein [Flavobacteriaceae bacterium]